MTKIYLDESGFTGDDLYNAEQRYFVVASTLIDDDEAEQLLRECFPRYQGQEFKFSNIWKRDASRLGLRALASRIPTLSERVFAFIVDKRFSLLVKLFDYLVEPAAYASGYDWYADGWGMRYMNTVHRDLLMHGGESLYDETVRLWSAFARSPSNATLTAFSTHVDKVESTSESLLHSMFSLLKRGLIQFRLDTPDLEGFTDSSEIQVTSVFSSIVWWRQHRSEDFDLVHDESSAFLKQQGMWNAMLSNDIEPQRFPIANGTYVDLPIRVNSTTGIRSHDSFAVQLCDVIAGFAGKAAPGLGGGSRDDFVLELVSLGAGELVYGGVMPHALYVDKERPKRREGPDVVDQMVGLLEPHFDSLSSKR